MINALLAIVFLNLYLLSIPVLTYKVICPILDYFDLNDTLLYVLITISGLVLYIMLTIGWMFKFYVEILRYTWS